MLFSEFNYRADSSQLKTNRLIVRFRGQSPGEAELHYLENAKNMAMYGMHMHEAWVSRLFSRAIIDYSNDLP